MPDVNACIAYYRVTSARARERDHIDAQRAAVITYFNDVHCQIIGEFTEIETGKAFVRPQLDAALAMARLHSVPIVIARVDRLTTSASFLSSLLDADVDVRFVDMPPVEGAVGRALIREMLAIAEAKADRLSARVKAELAAAKRSRDAWAAGSPAPTLAQIRASKANAFAAEIMQKINEQRMRGITSLQGIANALSEGGVPTRSGTHKWSGTQIKRILVRVEGYHTLPSTATVAASTVSTSPNACTFIREQRATVSTIADSARLQEAVVFEKEAAQKEVTNLPAFASSVFPSRSTIHLRFGCFDTRKGIDGRLPCALAG